MRRLLWHLRYTGPVAWVVYRWNVLAYFLAARGTDYYDPDHNMPWWLPWKAWLEFLWH